MKHHEIAPLVHADIDARIAKGTKEYGEPLASHNGRDALQDAYEEALDLSMYLKQELVERDAMASQAEGFKVGDRGMTVGGWEYTVTRILSVTIHVQHDGPGRHYVMSHGLKGEAGEFLDHQLLPPSSSALCRPRLRQVNRGYGLVWQCQGPSFDFNPFWDGTRRADTAESAYQDWQAMYDAHVAIYRVKGYNVPVGRPEDYLSDKPFTHTTTQLRPLSEYL